MSKFEEIINIIKDVYCYKNFIPLHEPLFNENDKSYVSDAIESSFVSSVGKYVDKFEEDLASYTNTMKAVAVVNGTSALQVALRLAGLKHGEEVITQALTFVATANAVKYNFCDPVFVDVDLDTMGLSPSALNDFLDEFAEIRSNGTFNKKTGKRIGAILPMHTFGFVCRMDEIKKIANQWNIPIVEDAAEALGSKYKGIQAGTFGNIGVYSFNGNKIITAGGGGAIVSKNNEILKKAKHLTTTAKVNHPWEYLHDELGYNYRMPNLNAALLTAQLERLNEFIESKNSIYNIYASSFKQDFYKLKDIPIDSDWNYWLMSIEFQNKKDRDEFLKETNTKNVMTRPIWRLMFELPMYSECQRDGQNNAIYLSERIVNIPSSAKKQVEN